MSKLAVVLFNLGGPDRPEAGRPCLFNLFNDPAIIAAPAPIRWALAQFISRRRAPHARAIYGEIGGGSPIVANTEEQAAALAHVLAESGREGDIAKVFVAMRYWHPRSNEVASAVAAFGPDEIVLLPLYPQFSTTTTASSVADWHRAARHAGLAAPTRTICCYPPQSGFIAGLASSVRAGLAEARRHGAPRLLLSAHGLPERIVARGDPYQWQVEETATALVEALAEPGLAEPGLVEPGLAEPGLAESELAESELDWRVCYQSRVGPLRWIGPATDDELRRAGADKVPVVLTPIAFVSEHSETLVELDVTYRDLAAASGVPHYVRTPTVGVQTAFIAGLAALVRAAPGFDRPVCSMSGERRCPSRFSGCPMAAGDG